MEMEAAVAPRRVASPWLTMWFRPRATIRDRLAQPPSADIYWLGALAGVSNALDKATMRHAGDTMELPTLVMVAVLAGAFWGVVMLWLGGSLLAWTGGWLGGRANSESMRTALAWASVPLIWSLLLWPPELYFFGADLFRSETPRIDASLPLYACFALLELAVAAWAIVVLLKSIGEAHGFSAWRALGNALVAMSIVLLPLLALAWLLLR